MTLKINRPPNQRGYQVQLRPAAMSQELRGGLSRARLDRSSPDRRVSVTYGISRAELASWTAFIDRVTFTGEAIKSELVIDSFSLLEYDCQVIPGSFSVNYISGSRADISFSMDAEETDFFSTSGDNAYMDLYDQYRSGMGDVLNLLAKLVNEDLPQ